MCLIQIKHAQIKFPLCGFWTVWLHPPPRPPEPKGGGQHSLACEGADGANSDDWRESLTLCTLCSDFFLALGRLLVKKSLDKHKLR
jgi:hypothetical protein